MKRSTLNLALLVLAIAFAPLRSWAQPTAAPPGQLSYQGFLTDANGIPLATNTPRNFNVVFRIYNSSTGPTPQWAEQQVVTVDRGYFTVMLGSGSSIDSTFTNDLTAIFSGGDASDRYLGITVQGLASPDAEIAPRLRLLASPYAFLAATALNASNALNAVNAANAVNAVNAVNAANVTGANTITASNLSTSIGLWSVAGGDVYRPSGNVGIGTTTPALKLQVNGVVGARDTTSADGYIDLQPGDSAHAGYLEIFKPGPTRLGYLGYSGGGANNFGLNLENSASFNINGGWVGIGTGGANPLAPLEVDGISTSFYVNGPFFLRRGGIFWDIWRQDNRIREYQVPMVRVGLWLYCHVGPAH